MLPALNSGGIHANQLGPNNRRNRSFTTSQSTMDHDSHQPENISPGLGIKKMVEWFSNWLPWQKKILLCGITERCSKSQLDLLVSTMEPVFHRDFVATLAQRYPSAGIRRMYERREARRAAALVYNSEDSMRDSNVAFNMDDGAGLSDAFRQSLSPDEEEFVERLTKNIFDEAFKSIQEGSKEQTKRDVLTPHERADIDALSPNRVFGGLTPQLPPSPDPISSRRTITSGAFRPSVEQVCHQHQEDIPGRISAADLRIEEIQSARGHGTERQSQRLRKKFNMQLSSIWKWLASWPEQEKVRVLAELVQLSDKVEIHYLSQCILLRLKSHGDVNSLPDKLLYQIFCMLPTSDLFSASQVCRRWHYIASRDELWMYKSFELGQRLGVPNVVSLVKRKFHRNVDNIDWRYAYRELSAIGQQAKQTIPLPVRAVSPVKQEATQSRKKSSRRYSRRAGSRAMSIASTGSRNGSFYTAYRHQVSRKSLPRSGRSSRASSVMSEIEEFVDRRPLMKPILGKLKRFQDSEDVALDVRPQLKQMNDVLGMSEAKEILCWKHDLERTGQRGTFITEVQPINQCRRLQGHLDSILCLQFDERRLITGSMDRSIRIWDVRSGRSIRKLYGHKGGIGCLHFTGNSLVSGSWDMTIMLWSLEPTFERRATLSGHINTVTGVKILDRYIISASLDGTVRVYSNISLYLEKVLNLQEPIQCMHCDGMQLFTGHTDRIIRITRFPSGEPFVSLRGHTDQILSIAVSGRLLISGGQLGYVRFWDWRNAACEAGVDTQPKSANDRVAVNSLAYYRGHFWTGHADGSIREWNLATMTCVRNLVGHKGTVRGLQVSLRRVVTASDDASSRIWEFPRPRRTDAPENEQQQNHLNRRGMAPKGELLKPRVLLQPVSTPH